ncbi:MAG: right-handed parallel beta-helix repeat-containing protein, partial [Candidatus Methanoperedens sp.]|nr:right-handed parallel beta-helix repeat-containing protein [Candidatus Methanoperedens sp.]
VWIILLIMLLVGGADAVTNINNCQEINQEGEYQLSQNLTNDSTCINILSSNVALDGAGFTINGTDTIDTYGVFVFNLTTSLTNVTVKNLTVADWENGIVFNNVMDGNITNTTLSSNHVGISLEFSNSNILTNNTASSNSRYGIELYSSSNNTLTNNTAELNGYGIYFTNSSSNTLTGNNASSNSLSGVYIESSSINILTNNIANSNDGNGIYLYYSNSSNLTDNTADLNDFHGFYFYAGNYTMLISNNASSNGKNGVYLVYSNGNTLTDSTASSNGENGVYLEFSSMNTLISNTANSNIDRGINLKSSNSNILINNTILNSPDGITIEEPSSDNSIIRNRVYSTTDQGIVLIRAFNSIIRENNLSFNSGEGMVLQGSWNNTISDNSANSNGQCGGICLLNSSGSTLANNTANSNTIGISLESSGGNILNDNTANSNDNYGIHIFGETALYTVPEVPFHFINVDILNASVASDEVLSDYGNYTIQYDNDYFIYELPFTFPFMGRNITRISANTNGLIELLQSHEDCDFDYGCNRIGTHYGGDHIGNMDAIFASNGDLVTDASARTYLGVFNLSDKVVVEWYGLTRTDEYPYGYNLSSNPIHFQVVLYPNGTIEWNLNEMKFSNYDFDMFTGIYTKEENIEIVGGYAINTQRSLAINLSTSLPAPEYNTIRDNIISNNNPGIFLESSSNTIYNNYFNNTNNAVASGSNTWNITRTIGSNIADGPYLGGNFWAHPNGSGLSQTCADANSDGICDSPHRFNSSNIDYLPLAQFLRKTSTSITVNTDVNANRTIEIDPDDSRNITNSVIELNATVNAPVILRINASTDARALNATPAAPAYGLGKNEQLTGRYIQVNVTGIDAGSLNFVNLTAYYTAADLDRNDDGDTEDPDDLNEKTLRVYWFNPNATIDSERWKPLGPGIEPMPDYTALGGPRVLGSEMNTAEKYLKVTLNHFSTFALAAEVASAQSAPGSGSGSSGGSGGGGIITSEPSDNIAKAEKLEKNLIADRPVTYTFTIPGIYEVDITGKENENDIALRVEILKGTSKLVSTTPPGTIYKNVNIWAGTKKIKEAVIRFRIENSWLNSSGFAGSDIKALKWSKDRWTQIDTTELRKDESYTYYELKADSLSHFAISGLKGASALTDTQPAVSQITPAATGSPEIIGTPVGMSPVNLTLIMGVLVLTGVLVMLYISKNRTKR